ncbi:MAG: hypothetical protein M1819_002837 [Sarea resinae]|nr:MAG: hypothetical protein M1819_002837 [Sarea resinae]
MLAISRLNYPGAEALIRLHDLAHGSKGIIAVHLDDLSCTTGITRFLEMPAPTSFMAEGQTSWIYDKTEEPQKLLSPEFWAHFDFALMERPEKAIGAWEIVEVIDGFAGIGLTKLGDRDLGDVENARSRPSSAETESSEDIVMSRGSWLKEVEKIIRDKITSGWWIEVKMKPMINIMKRLR